MFLDCFIPQEKFDNPVFFEFFCQFEVLEKRR